MAALPPAEAGHELAAAAGAIGRRLRELAAARGALFALELREEAGRGADVVTLAAAAATFLHLALLLVAATALIAAWDTHRLATSAAMALVYGACGLGCLARMRRRVASAPAPFAATRAEFGLDLDAARRPS